MRLHSKLSLIIALAFTAGSIHAATVDDLKAKIASKTDEIKKLEEEIAAYEQQILTTGKEKQSLTQAIKSLEATKKKLQGDISVTTKQIEAMSLTIQELASDIGDKENRISQHHLAIASSLRDVDREDGFASFDVILSENTVSDLLDTIESAEQYQLQTETRITELNSLKAGLESSKTAADREKNKLLTAKAKLDDQKKIAESNRVATNKLLTATKNKESNFKKILADKLARKSEFERELLDYESQLRITIDATALPTSGTKALSWPLTKVLVTQYFGNTDFAKNHTAVYNGNGHNGIDLRAAIGTPILAAASGTVVGTGDTDLTCAGASYGKWVLIRHLNGLTTLYAHFSLIKVSQGDTVTSGQLIGYSGETGYATGPHLHFTVFATQGVSVGSLKSKNPSCGTYTLPRASLNSYLDPMQYL